MPVPRIRIVTGLTLEQIQDDANAFLDTLEEEGIETDWVSEVRQIADGSFFMTISYYEVGGSSEVEETGGGVDGSGEATS